MSSSHPIACKLSDPERHERLDALRAGLFARTRLVRHDDEHITFTFAGNDEVVRSLMEFIVLERECCPFLRFTLDIPPEPDDVRLILGGDSLTRTFVQQTFVSLVSIEGPTP